jgi:hypothetical protein
MQPFKFVNWRIGKLENLFFDVTIILNHQKHFEYYYNVFILFLRDLRQALNRWCSGMAQKKPCTFNLQLDHEESVSWGMGIVSFIPYFCLLVVGILVTLVA